MMKKRLGAIALGLAVAGILSVSAMALEQGAYTAPCETYYLNPDTGVTDDGGSQNVDVGEGMCRSAVNETALLEMDNGQTYITIRMKLMSNIRNIQFAVQQTPGDPDSYEEVSCDTMQESASKDTADFRFEVPAADSFIRCSMYVIPMKRDVLFYMQTDAEKAVPGNGDFVPSVSETAAPAPEESSSSGTADAAGSRKLLNVDLWNASADRASMGNVAMENNRQALYDPSSNTLQIATNPVNVSGYISGITQARYDTSGNGAYEDVKTLSTVQVETGTKNDGSSHTITTLSCFEISLPDYVRKSGVEYIPVQFIVPYTPMDVAVGKGYLDARLRLDWGTAADTEQTALNVNSNMSSGGVVNIDLKDDATGIQLSADSSKVDIEATLSVTAVSSGTAYETAKQALSGLADAFTLYNVTLRSDEAETAPTGAVTLVFPFTGEVSMYRINSDGTKTVLKGTAGTDGYSVMTTKTGLFAVVSGEKTGSAGTFADVGNHWAKDFIQRAVKAGLFNGTSETTFSPNKPMTSGMVMTVLYRLAGSPEVTLTGTVDNVAAGAWYEKASAWGYSNAIIGGYKTYEPTQAVTREELATMLFRYYSLAGTPTESADLSAFQDAGQLSAWAKEGMTWANAVGIVNGIDENTLSPHKNATRAEVATMLCRYLDYVGK